VDLRWVLSVEYIEVLSVKRSLANVKRSSAPPETLRLVSSRRGEKGKQKGQSATWPKGGEKTRNNQKLNSPVIPVVI